MHTFPSATSLVEDAVSTADALRLHIHKPLAGNTAAVGQVVGVEVGGEWGREWGGEWGRERGRE